VTPMDLPRDVVLSGGSPGRVRTLVPADREAILEGFHALSGESRNSRFFYEKKSVSETELDDVSQPDGVDHLALLLEVPQASGAWKLIAIARCFRDPRDSALAEVAFVTSDEWQGKGAGSVLIQALAEVAWRAGIRRWFASILTENRGARRLLGRVGRLSEESPAEAGTREFICHLHEPSA
jgi:GNAT superfamily N-acetyltransferase